MRGGWMLHCASLSLLVVVAAGCVCGSRAGQKSIAPAAASQTIAQRRAVAVEAAQQGPAGRPALERALKDENVLVRRVAARGLAQLGSEAAPALTGALEDSDGLVRRTALQALVSMKGPAPLAALEKAMHDPSAEVRQMAVTSLIALQPRTEQVAALLRDAQKDKSPTVRALAIAAMWPFHRDTVLFRERPDVADVSGNVVVVQTIPLPKEGWSFATDPEDQGHLNNWFTVDFNDKDWKRIPIEAYWPDDYEGTAWYRRTITLPEKQPHAAAELHFTAVDESAWVWVNGVYVGQHDVGPAGYNQPFALDVTNELRWGAENQITIRVLSTEFAGGINKPVSIETLKLK